MIAPLADTCSAKVMAVYDEKRIQWLASESPEIMELRRYLEGKKAVLEEGQIAFESTGTF